MRLFGARLLVKEIKFEEKKGGIIIPGREEEQTNTGKIVMVGNGALLENGEPRPMDFKVGDTVIYTHFSGSPVKVKNETYLVLNERDVLIALDEDECTI